MLGPDQALVLYDADCGFCRWCMGKILAWDVRGRLRTLALQDPTAAALLPGMTEEDRMASWHLVEPGGAARSAGAAFAPMLRRLPAGGALAAACEQLPGPCERGYRWVADRRAVWGRAITAGALARAQRRIAARELASPGSPAGSGE